MERSGVHHVAPRLGDSDLFEKEMGDAERLPDIPPGMPIGG
ncbi:hypothetical protein [Altericroceibacterium indicum]|nr:hypothetical protein [Altericroceibacterium indicum]